MDHAGQSQYRRGNNWKEVSWQLVCVSIAGHLMRLLRSTSVQGCRKLLFIAVKWNKCLTYCSLAQTGYRYSEFKRFNSIFKRFKFLSAYKIYMDEHVYLFFLLFIAIS